MYHPLPPMDTSLPLSPSELWAEGRSLAMSLGPRARSSMPASSPRCIWRGGCWLRSSKWFTALSWFPSLRKAILRWCVVEGALAVTILWSVECILSMSIQLRGQALHEVDWRVQKGLFSLSLSFRFLGSLLDSYRPFRRHKARHRHWIYVRRPVHL